MSSLTPLIGRRQALAGTAAAILGLAVAPPARAAHVLPFGRYGSPRHRLNDRTLYVDAQGQGDHVTVQAAVDATPDTPAEGWTLVIAAGTLDYPEVDPG